MVKRRKHLQGEKKSLVLQMGGKETQPNLEQSAVRGPVGVPSLKWAGVSAYWGEHMAFCTQPSITYCLLSRTIFDEWRSKLNSTFNMKNANIRRLIK